MGLIASKYKKRLNAIKRGVTRQFAKGKPTNWRNRDFEDLSFEINKATKVLISAATLKRIFGKHKTSETYYPQESTLEALEKYAEIKKGISQSTTFFNKRFITAAIAILIVLSGTIFLLLTLKKNKTDSAIKAKVSVSKLEGSNPTSVFFDYTIPTTKDSLFISFGDNSPLKYLAPENNSLSHFYGHPGLFEVSVQNRSKVVADKVLVLIPTSGWQALASYYRQTPSDRFYPIPERLSASEEGFHLTGRNLASIGIDTTQIVVLRLDNFKKTRSNGDNFVLKTRLKNVSYWPAIRCYSAYINVIGENGTIMFKLTNKGCSSFGEFTLSEKSAHGSSTDLTGFSLDIKSWNDVEIENLDKNVKVSINSQLIFEESYNKSIGNITGISLLFHGSGYVDYFEMYDKENQPVFMKDF